MRGIRFLPVECGIADNKKAIRKVVWRPLSCKADKLPFLFFYIGLN